MLTNSKAFEVDKPVHEVYQKWLNYDGLADFAPFLKEVRKTGERTSHWVAESLGIRQEWDAEIVDMQENRRLSWRSTSGLENRGEVLFEPIHDDRTRVTVNFAVQPMGDSFEGTRRTEMERAVEADLDQATKHVKVGIEHQ